MVPACRATSSTGSPGPHSTAGVPTCTSDSSDTSAAIMSIDTRPTIGARSPPISSGVPPGSPRASPSP